MGAFSCGFSCGPVFNFCRKSSFFLVLRICRVRCPVQSICSQAVYPLSTLFSIQELEYFNLCHNRRISIVYVTYYDWSHTYRVAALAFHALKDTLSRSSAPDFVEFSLSIITLRVVTEVCLFIVCSALSVISTLCSSLVS